MAFEVGVRTRGRKHQADGRRHGNCRVGDIRLDLQVEQRMRINDVWQAALFSDMGNVWLHGEAPEAAVWSWDLEGFGWGWHGRSHGPRILPAPFGRRPSHHDPGKAAGQRWLGQGRGKVRFTWVWACLLIHDFKSKTVENCRLKTDAKDRLICALVWFKRNAEGIPMSAEKKEIPEGAWYKCPNCKTVVSNQDHENNLWVCAMCDHHERIEATNTLAFF